MFDGVCFTYTLKIYMLVTVVFWTNFSILTFLKCLKLLIVLLAKLFTFLFLRVKGIQRDHVRP